MGMFMSFMGKGLASSQLLTFAMGTLYKQFIEKDLNNFDEFHFAILDIFNSVSSALSGKHYDVPLLQKEVEACFTEWKEAKEAERKNIFVEFMKKNVRLSKLDDATMITGIFTPPAAMVAKRAGENIPQLKLIKAIPDIFFVPSATILALVTAKLSKRIFMRNMGS